MLTKTGRSSALVFKNVVRACRYASSESTANATTYEETADRTKMAGHFGTLGLKSGVDIRKLWPTVEEIQEIQELRLHRTAREATEIAKEAERKKAERYAKREKDVEEKMKEYE